MREDGISGTFCIPPVNSQAEGTINSNVLFTQKPHLAQYERRISLC